MKKIQFLFYAFLLVGSVACKKTDSKTDYKVQSEKDLNGYVYETVSNDPTGLRLYTLDNGLKVYLSQNKDEPTIQTFIPVRAGSNYDPKDNTGLAHYLEHMVFKGTDKIATLNWEEEKKLIAEISDLYEKHKAEPDLAKKLAIYREIDSISYIASGYAVANEYDKMVSLLGASGTNAHTWYEETVYKNKIPANELEKWASLESERFGKLVLRLFHTELEAVYEEFNRGQDNDGRKAHYAKMEALFPTHPYGQQTTIGTSEHLKNPSMVAIKNYFDTYYVPNNMAVVLVGDIDFDKTIKTIDATFGKFEFKEVKHPELPKEEPLAGIVSREVFGPNNESVTVSFRTGGIGSEDQKYITLIDMILANSSAGLMDLNLNQKQLVQYATSSPFFQNDYGTLTFSGTPKAGQTLDEVKDLMLSQAELIKSGDFEDWMIEAVVNDLKLTEMRGYENSTALASMYYNAFIHDEKWSDKIRFLDDLKKISKNELVSFANDFFNNNYVVVYKRQGEDKNIAKVENPGITPIQINRGAESDYLKEFVKIESTDLQPVFVDYKKEIQADRLESGLEVSNIKNLNNDLFNLNIIFDMGKDNDKKLSLAVGYLEFLGTDQYSAEELKKEFYKLGINYSVSTGNDRSYVAISGLQENLDPGLELLEHLMDNVVADQEAYDLYVERILKAREDGKTQKGNILQNGLNSFAQYGEDSRLRNIYTAEELKNMDVSELVDIITDLNNYKHRIFYYGKDVQAAKTALNKHHKVLESLKEYPPAKEYKQLATGKNVYFADFDMVQAEMFFIAKGEQFDAKKMALATVFNSYFGQGFSSVVLQEIRESKGLAYAAAAGYLPSSKKENYDRTFAYIGTQANKVPEAVEAMLNLLNNMPEAEQQFITAKESALKQIASQRITKSNIFWSYENLKKRGLDYDNREEMYKEIQEMTMADLSNFFASNIKGQDYSVSVIGNKKDLDMQALKKLGKVHEMDIDYLFNYQETEVKQ
ncbi:insulinase family protein [Lutimonas saemankumensis]|uniref:M16 family metallopeptidase n=1 Tax=Lutimonas saemankumensis TaxID=483016 RepID=UPI001CD459F1|nr:M16 family metallopeptidase [Lutimonas saemankumensis]MCA0931947.1 insulinase family protein [Lutimonas saemankumensis]